MQARSLPRRMSRAESGVAIRLDQVSFVRSLVIASTVSPAVPIVKMNTNGTVR